MTAPVFVKVLSHGEGLPLPAYHSEGAAGMDLRAAVPASERLLIAPGAHMLVPTGLCLHLPAGYEGQIRPRSGLALKYGVTVLNSPGTIDCDYRGEIGVILMNHGDEPFAVERGDRIAQLVIASVVQAKMIVIADLGATARGGGGFGSTGT